MLFFTLFFIELFLLFLLSRNLSRNLSHFFYSISKSKNFTIITLSILFLPGTIIHEFSHAIAARLLGVHVGTMEFMPQIEGEHVKLGSVQVAHTDPIRRFFIGTAPFLFGTAIMMGLLFYFVQNRLYDNYLFAILVGYGIFEVGNTMFSSRKDMEGALKLFGILIFVIIVLYFLGVRLPSFNPNSFLSQPLIHQVFQRGSLFLLIPLAIDAVIIILLRPIYKN